MARPLLIPLLLAAAAFADDRVSLEMTDAPVEAVLRRIHRATGAKIHLSRELAARRITIRLDRTSLADALARIARTVGAHVAPAGGGAYHLVGAQVGPPAPWKMTMLELLSARVPKRRWKGSTETIEAALGRLRPLAGRRIVIDPRVNAQVYVRVQGEELTVRDLLTLVVRRAGYAWDLRYGVVFVSTRARLAALPRRLGLHVPALETKKVNIHFKNMQLKFALQYIGRMSGHPVEVAKSAEGAVDAAFTSAQARQISALHAFELILVPAGLGASARNGTIHVEPR